MTKFAAIMAVSVTVIVSWVKQTQIETIFDSGHLDFSFCFWTIDIKVKNRLIIMACTACLVCLVNSVSGSCKNTLRRVSASRGHITKLEQSTFVRYLCFGLVGLKFNNII